MWRKGNPPTLLLRMKISVVWQFLKKVKRELLYNLAIPLLEIYLKKQNHKIEMKYVPQYL